MQTDIAYDQREDGLKLASIHLKDFRNYDEFDFQNIGNLTIFAGQNAVGKTSIIEAIELVTALQSFRSTRTDQLVKWNRTTSLIRAGLKSESRDLDLKMKIEEGKRFYYLNEKKKSIQELKGLLPSVIFTPDDLDLVKGSNSARRNAIDSLASQLSRNFYTVKNDYTKLIKQKNRALKDDASDDYIESINEILVKVGIQLLAHRLIIIGKIQPLFQEYYSRIVTADEQVELIYLPFWVDENTELWEYEKEQATRRFETELKNRIGEERSRLKAVVGPHSDHINFYLNGKNAVHFASQGQQRSIVLAFKLAELAVIKDTLHQRPILLLDDVMSELDASRRDAFLKFISEDIQTFITTTNILYFNDEIIQKACVVSLPAERVRGIES